MATVPGNGRLRDEPPTSRVCCPGPAVHAPADVLQTENARSCTVMLTRLVWPGFRLTFAKPLSCLGGSPAEAGADTYTWTTSAPARVPVLVTSTDTLVALADRLAIENVVYDRPNPNGNSGVSLCASYH